LFEVAVVLAAEEESVDYEAPPGVGGSEEVALVSVFSAASHAGDAESASFGLKLVLA